jgi:predicted RNA-binding Zn-ribbon protein involved in translation (DUF1610 family)
MNHAHYNGTEVCALCSQDLHPKTVEQQQTLCPDCFADELWAARDDRDTPDYDK